MDFFPNQAALDGFLQVGLRNRIGKLGGTGSPILHVDGSPVRLECSPKNMLKLYFGALSCRLDVALRSL